MESKDRGREDDRKEELQESPVPDPEESGGDAEDPGHAEAGMRATLVVVRR